MPEHKVRIVNRKEVLIDPEDEHLLDLPGWTTKRHRHTGYVGRYVLLGKGRGAPRRHEYLHRAIMDPPHGLVVDHINGNGLDNRRSNLRVVTHTINAQNLQPDPYRNIYLLPTGTFNVKLKRNKQPIYLGTYATLVDAQAALATYHAESANDC